MSENGRKNILELFIDQNLGGYIKRENEKVILENLYIPSTVNIKIANEILVDSKSIPYYFSNQSSEKRTLIFINCEFEGILNISNFTLFFNIELRDCEINQLKIDKVKNRLPDQFSFKIVTTTIKDIVIENCYFTDRFYINSQEDEDNKYQLVMNNLLIKNTIFSHNFKLHNCEIQYSNINNTDFEKNAYFVKSKFLEQNEIKFKSINFRGLALFRECEFTSKFCLEYVRFEGICNFQQSEFKNGLDLDTANIEKEMNFYAVKGLENKESKLNTSQETYRIIKSNFVKIGNQIEANRFHGLELEKRADFLNEHWKNYFLEWFVFKVHWLSSKFATNWILPLFWIVCLGALTNEYLNYSVYKPFTFEYKFSFDLFLDFWNKTAHYMSIVSDDDPLKNTPWLFLVNKVALGYLYYQFVSAIRKDTKQS